MRVRERYCRSQKKANVATVNVRSPAAVAFVIGTLSCGTTPPTASGTVPVSPFPPDHVSGTRLRARYWLAGDGTRHMDAANGTPWDDTKLPNPCSIQPMSPRIDACLPVVPSGML